MKIIISPYSQKLRNGKENPKNYPYWDELINLLGSENIIQVGVSGEKPLVEDCRFNLPLSKLKKLVTEEMDIFFSVDNFFPHFCNHYNKRGVVIFSRSNPAIFGYPDNLNLFKSEEYFRKDQFGFWESVEYSKEPFLQPQTVMDLVKMYYEIALEKTT